MRTQLTKLSTLIMLTLFTTACGDNNKLSKLNPFSSSSSTSNPISHGGDGLSGQAQFVAQYVQCRTGSFGNSGQSRVTSQFFAQGGSYHNGYYSQYLQQGSSGGNVTSVAIGVSVLGDIIEVRSKDNGGADILLHLCEHYPLIIPGQRAVDRAILNSLVIKSRPGCRGGDEVTSASLMVQVPSYQHLSSANFLVTFSRYEDVIQGACNN